ncbi:MAG: phenylacetate--CoA ligase [Armatimonadota bacterium]|nr:phenylacetate--CoA ligase [Armatimonadota bacterium]
MPYRDDAVGLSGDEIERMQVRLLRETVERARTTPAYAERLEGIAGEEIASPEDVRKLPLTTKEQLRDGMPHGFLAVEPREVIRMHYSSGTTGLATAVYHTRDDVDRWSECVARGMLAAGVTDEDVFQNMMGYGLFTGGLGFHYAGELIGCMTIPASSGNTERQIHLMESFASTVLHIIPSYALRVLHMCREQGIDPREDLSVRVIFVGGEPHSEQLRRRIEEGFGARVYNCYGLSEMCGPGVAMECAQQSGLHVCEDHYVAEVLDPETLQPVEPGQPGELVLTTLRREAMPLIRYRTRDIVHLIPGECPCGSRHGRISRIEGRTDDMLVVKGVNVYPMQVERALLGVEQVGDNYVITIDRPEDLDRMTVAVELAQEAFTDQMRQLNALRDRIARRLHSELDISVEVELHEPGELPVTDGKAVRVIDRREQETQI